jgi:hypothetical protein
MRNVVVGVVGGLALLLATAGSVQAQQWGEFGRSIALIPINIFYIPAKILTAAVGLPIGGLAGVTTAGSTRAAYGVWVPTASGSWVVRPSNLDGTRRLEFFGSDYADSPSPTDETGYAYRARYADRTANEVQGYGSSSTSPYHMGNAPAR